MVWLEVREGDGKGGRHPLNRRREREREERDQRERHSVAREVKVGERVEGGGVSWEGGS